jgi:pimeloyl-ACP methyl ester carboxylesterase
MRVLFRALALVGVLTAGLLAPHDAKAAGARFTACGDNGLECTKLTVPLDRTGVTPGTITLYVERLLPDGLPRGTMFLVAGGPGQPSAETFNLAENGTTFKNLFPGYTLVAFDNRGTGKSDVISCPRLQAEVTATVEQQARYAAECATIIGPTRRFYATRDHAEDTESVRQAIGADRIGLWGTSYGTKLAVAYALAHPDHVDRLLLDSIVLPEGSDPLATQLLRSMPSGLASLCRANACRSATPSLPADVAALANRLAAHPISGRVPQPGGKSRLQRLDGVTFLGVVIDTDLNPGLAAELPAAVRAALRGVPRPLLRIVALDQQSSSIRSKDLSFGLLAATNCADGHFPWAPDTPVAQRKALLDAARAALPAGATGPFGRWATDLGSAALCIQWPSPSGGAPLGPGPLPDVPVLILTGDRDLRTPVANALELATRFRHADVTIVPGVGHSVQSADYTGCANGAIAAWLSGSLPPRVCNPVSPLVAPLAAFPSSVRTLTPLGAGGLRGRTLAAAVRTIREAGATWTLAATGFGTAPARVAGPYGGFLRPAKEGAVFSLVRYSTVPGVELSGKLQLEFGIVRAIIPFRFVGSIKVSGPNVARGALEVGGSSITGTLGGRRVSARI